MLSPQVGIGIFTKSTAEYAKRGENFSQVCTSPLQGPSHIAGFAIPVHTTASVPIQVDSHFLSDIALLQELDFVLANVIMALVADFMLVWLPAPTLSFK